MSVIDRWPTHPLLVKTFAQNIKKELLTFPEDIRSKVSKIFMQLSLNNFYSFVKNSIYWIPNLWWIIFERITYSRIFVDLGTIQKLSNFRLFYYFLPTLCLSMLWTAEILILLRLEPLYSWWCRSWDGATHTGSPGRVRLVVFLF